MKIGFIGLGNMGAAIAANLVRAGHAVTVYNRTGAKADPLVRLGAQRAAHLGDACNGEVVITMLADDHAVAEVVWGEQRILASLRGGCIHVSMSTISVELSRRLAEAHSAAGQRYVAAPVFGRPEAAAAAKLFIVPAGDPAAIAACQPLFDAIGQKTTPVGEDPTMANLVKLSGNFLIVALIECLGEAIALVAKAGVDRSAYVKLLTSTMFPAPVYGIYGSLIAEEKFLPAGFAVPLGHKDVRLMMDAAESLRVPMPIVGLLNDRFLRLLAQGAESLDWSALGGLALQDAGIGGSLLGADLRDAGGGQR
jgi:3-hydroxyisobutyrate dehydrogenase-like beta-hydroxyacid dehydrogenase